MNTTWQPALPHHEIRQQVIYPTKSIGTNGILYQVVVNLQCSITEIFHKVVPPPYCVIQSFFHWGFREVFPIIVSHPFPQPVQYRKRMVQAQLLSLLMGQFHIPGKPFNPIQQLHFKQYMLCSALVISQCFLKIPPCMSHAVQYGNTFPFCKMVIR